MNVVLVTHDSIFGRYLAASLHRAGAVNRVVIERGRPSNGFYRRKLKRVGLTNAAFQFWLNRWFRREGARWLPDLLLPPHETVKSVNAYAFNPDDLVIGFGTSIVSARTLDGMQRGFLNLHTGWLPDYRGVKSEFWTVARGDPAKMGWTLHYMTPRLDDGDIVIRRSVPVVTENPAKLRAILLQDAAAVLPAFIEGVRRSGFDTIPREAQGEGAYFTTPTLADWRRYRRSL